MTMLVLQIIYPLLPFLIPAFLSLLIVKFTMASKKSRTRLQILEADSARERLSRIIAKLEREIETATLDAYENTGLLLSIDPPSRGAETGMLVPKAITAELEALSHDISYLTPGQLKCLENLNKIPRLRKTIAFIAEVDNAHPLIVCRSDVKVEHHRKGEGVLRHWADHFEL